MILAIFGGTGRTGQQVVEQALAAGHEVRVLARTPGKLKLENPRLTIYPGDIQEAKAVSKTIMGAEAVISVLGPTSNQPGQPVSQGMKNILAAMQEHAVTRLIVSAGAGVGDPNDAPKLLNKLINVLLKVASKYVYEDMLNVVALVRASDRAWTVVRVPMLADGAKTGQVRVGWVGKGMGPRITRADMADFMLKQLSDRTFVRQAPAISN